MKTTTEQIIGTREAAEIIGMSQRWVQMEADGSGRLSHLAQRAGRWFVFRRSDIEAFAEEYNAVPQIRHREN